MESSRSGTNPVWVRSLKPIGKEGSEAYFASLRIMPLKFCESKDKCIQLAEYYVDMHGCLIGCMCYDHLDRLVRDVRLAVTVSGAHCGMCQQTFTSHNDFVKWRKV